MSRSVVVGCALALAVVACDPLPPPCNGDETPSITVAGAACDNCIVDFGDITVPLQDERRIDVRMGCDENNPPIDAQIVDADPAFTMGTVQLPFTPGGVGFVTVHFTPSSAGAVTGTVEFDFNTTGALDVSLQGNGVTP